MTVTLSALSRIDELQGAINSVEAKLSDLRLDEELAIGAPLQARRELRAYFDAVLNGERADDTKVRKALEAKIVAAEDRISTGPRDKKFVIQIQAKASAITRNELRPAKQALLSYVKSHRDDLARELLERSYEAQTAVLAARDALEAALVHSEAIRSAWQPYLNAWNTSDIGNPLTDLPAYNDTSVRVNSEVPAPRSLVATGTSSILGIGVEDEGDDA